MSRVAIWKQRRVLDTSHYAKLVIYIVPILVASGLLWYFRHSIYPMSATAVLKVIAYGAIPIALAWAGDHLAAEAVSEPRKKRMYRTFFVLFAALGIILIAKVEKKIEDDHATEVTQQKAEVKEQKANLKTVMSKMTELTADVSALEQRLNVPRVVVKRQTAPEPPPTEETRLHKMDSSQLRQYALDWAKK